MSEDKHLFCFGLGYVASNFAKKLLEQGWRVSGTCRSSEKIETFRPLGITSYIFDNDIPLQEIWDLNTVTHILHSIPPNQEGYDVVLKYHRDDLLKIPNLEWVGYLSTTGVYGDHQGNWVDEDTKTSPTNDRSLRRASAEQEWLSSLLPAHIFRLSGIYGVGRSAFDALENGTAKRINKKNQVFSRIHLEDIIQVLQASINSPNTGQIYNIADDEPAPQAEIVEFAAKLAGVVPPPLVNFEEANLSEMAKSFYSNNRRVSNKKIKEQLGVDLKFPTYREGLENIFKNSS